MVMEEEEVTDESLLQAVETLYENRNEKTAAMAAASHIDSIRVITDLIESCVRK